MQTEVSSSGFLSEQMAKDLLNAAKELRQDWACFALQSKVYFDALREKGASLPKAFLDPYSVLEQRKRELARTITSKTSHITADLWQPPSGEDSLHEFESALEDLLEFCRELEREIAKKRDRFIRILSSISELSFIDQQTAGEFEAVKRDAVSELNAIAAQPHHVADVELGSKIAGTESLLRLIADSARRSAELDVGQSGAESPMSSEECEHLFEVVSQRFGRRIAIESIRARLAPSANIGGVAISPIPFEAATTSTSLAPTKQALASLLEHYGDRSAIPSTSAKRTVPSSSATPARAYNPVSLRQLAAAADQLRRKADLLKPEGNESDHHLEQRGRDKIRAFGFSNLAIAIELVGTILSKRDKNPRFYRIEFPQLLKLFAEAQNAVRVEWEDHGIRGTQVVEQETAFLWLKHTCSEANEAVHIERYMRLDDRADPLWNVDLARRLYEFEQQLRQVEERDQHFDELESNVRQLISRIQVDDSASLISIWTEVDQHVASLLQLHVRPNEVRLRDILLPVADHLPESSTDEDGNKDLCGIEVSSEFEKVLEAIHDYLRNGPSDKQELSDDDSPVLQEARRLLTGKRVAIVGGVCKPHAAARVKRDLQLEELKWLTATKRDRVSDFESEIRDVSLVVLITKLIGHKHTDIREMCKRHGIPCVQTKVNAGYSVNQIAAVVLEQASEQLEAMAPYP